jgi:hypothetical protein
VQLSQTKSSPRASVTCPAGHSSQALGACLPVRGHLMTFVFSRNCFDVGSYTPATTHLPLTRLPNAIGSTLCALSSNTTWTGVEFSAALSFNLLFQTFLSIVRVIKRGLNGSPRHSLMTLSSAHATMFTESVMCP